MSTNQNPGSASPRIRLCTSASSTETVGRRAWSGTTCPKEGFVALPSIVEASMDMLVNGGTASEWLIGSFDMYSELLDDLRNAVSTLLSSDSIDNRDILSSVDVQQKMWRLPRRPSEKLSAVLASFGRLGPSVAV